MGCIVETWKRSPFFLIPIYMDKTFDYYDRFFLFFLKLVYDRILKVVILIELTFIMHNYIFLYYYLFETQIL